MRRRDLCFRSEDWVESSGRTKCFAFCPLRRVRIYIPCTVRVSCYHRGACSDAFASFERFLFLCCIFWIGVQVSEMAFSLS